MKTFLAGPGFLGTRALLYADLSLILILVSAFLFTIGWRLAVHKKFEAHRWVQTTAAILNAFVVLLVMIPSFIMNIFPGIPAKLLEGTYGVTTIHGITGAIGLLLGLFVVIRANELTPKFLRFKNYKLFMRTSYALYMLSTLIGLIVYIWVYILGTG